VQAGASAFSLWPLSLSISLSLSLSLALADSCIDALPGVATSAAVSVPDEKMGETVGVFISRVSAASSSQSALTPESVRAHVKEHLSGQSAPDWVWFLNEDQVPASLPTTASGKVQKVVLREWAKDLSERGVGRAKRKSAS
jgi:acyl-CoA synthetase (AMP-forming)/AMP-acid ligase II